MLTVAAARLEETHSNPLLVKALRETADWCAKRAARGEGSRAHWDAEEKRIGRQRTLMAMLPDTRAADALKAAMLQRAYDLMWDGDAQSCDALVEFLPSKDVERMFQAWDCDQTGTQPRSPFYEAKP